MEGRTLRAKKIWLLWVLLMISLSSWLGYALMERDDKRLFMPGPLTDGHHQLADKCDLCHQQAFGGKELLQEACWNCHKDEHKKPFDSHPKTKFSDPRNADTLEHINALYCVSCHVEHQPEIANKDGLTQPEDFCVFCHEDIGKERVTHEGMDFMSCKDSGCHNFHNNRDIYTDFLLKHVHEPDILDKPQLPQLDLAGAMEEVMEYPHDRYPLKKLDEPAADAPAGSKKSEVIMGDWLSTAHSASGVNCSACHMVASTESGTEQWQDHPGDSQCANCHQLEQERFGKGKHGMRLAAGLPAMTVSEARLPMNEESAHKTLTCLSCHGAHRFDTRTAAVEACLDCHVDEHSLAYTKSRHFQLWRDEVSGRSESGTGVSCASCHMPRIDFDINDWVSRLGADHNQSANLSPNSKMLRSSCLHCHGMGFSLDSLADTTLINKNFIGKSQVHVRSLELAEEDHRRAIEERKEAVTTE